MKILVINASPKGEYSITLQTSKYLEKKFPAHSFEYLNAGKQIRALEKDFTPALQAINRAELLLFSYPVFTFVAPSQLHRFIELMKENGADVLGKSATQITTSKHFYDMTAHAYIRENCQDMGMNVLAGLSQDMEDLLSEKGQKDAEAFFNYACFCLENGIFERKCVDNSAKALDVAFAPEEETKKTVPGTVCVVSDIQENDLALLAMVDRFIKKLPVQAKHVNIRKLNIMGGCLGCFNCAADGTCVYKDGFDTFLREEIETADAIVYAFTISDHSMGSRFKMFDDRRFCNGHRAVTEGTPMGYLVNGALSLEKTLGTLLEAKCQVGGNAFLGIAASETDANGEIDRLALSVGYAVQNRYTQPRNFYGVGGMKIFRDLIYQMQGLMREDHKFFKKHGKYDFPQKKRGTILKMYLVGMLMNNKAITRKMGNSMNEGMIAPYKKVLDAVSKENQQ